MYICVYTTCNDQSVHWLNKNGDHLMLPSAGRRQSLRDHGRRDPSKVLLIFMI